MKSLLETIDRWVRDASGKFTRAGKTPKPDGDAKSIKDLTKEIERLQDEAVWFRRQSRHSSRREEMTNKYLEAMDKIEALSAQLDKLKRAAG